MNGSKTRSQKAKTTQGYNVIELTMVYLSIFRRKTITMMSQLSEHSYQYNVISRNTLTDSEGFGWNFSNFLIDQFLVDEGRIELHHAPG